MAEEASSSGGGANRLWAMIAVIFVLMAIGTAIERIDFSGGVNAGVSSLVPTGSIMIGEDVVTRGATNIRQALGGAIIGEQPERAAGVITQGPQTAFGKEWVFVDYKNDPDGWVPVESITTEVGWFRALNIFPIFFDVFRPVGIFLSLIFFVLLVLVLLRYKKASQFEQQKRKTERELQLRDKKQRGVAQKEMATIQPSSIPGVPSNLPTGSPDGLAFTQTHMGTDQTGVKNDRWDRVERLVKSTNSNDWRQAVIEADIILDEMLTKMGYDGDSIGDKLKKIEQSDFVTLNKAWEAHKVRNHLAHRGTEYIFPKNDAERVIGLYRQVFQEFYYI